MMGPHAEPRYCYEKLELVASASLPPDLKVLLGPPQFLDCEDASAFDALYEKIRSAVAPRDVFVGVGRRRNFLGDVSVEAAESQILASLGA